jgi:hypothetical protein
MSKETSSLEKSKTQSKGVKKNNPKICKTITNDYDDEEKKLQLFRREFPAAFERFLHENGSGLPIYKPLSRSILSESESLLPSPSESKIGDIFHEYLISDEETAAYCVLCNWGGNELVPSVIKNIVTETSEITNAAIFSDIWIAVSIFFCIGSSYYMPEDGDNVGSLGLGGNLQVSSEGRNRQKKKIKKKKSFVDKTLEVITSSLEIFEPTESLNFAETSKLESPKNVLEFSRRGDYKNDMQLLLVDLGEESQRIMKIFVGILRERNIILNWNLRTSKKEVTVHTCEVPGIHIYVCIHTFICIYIYTYTCIYIHIYVCIYIHIGSVWQAVKSDCIIKQDRFEIVKLLMDDTRSHEYDDTMEGFQVWPCICMHIYTDI